MWSSLANNFVKQAMEGERKTGRGRGRTRTHPSPSNPEQEDTLAETIVKQNDIHPHIQSVSDLLAQGYVPDGGESQCSLDESKQSGDLVFVKTEPSIPIEQTDEYRNSSPDIQRRLKGCSLKGATISRFSVPFHSTLVFGTPRQI